MSFITDIMVFCYFPGSEQPFSVKTNQENVISQLKRAIIDDNMNTFGNVDPANMILWRVDIPPDKVNDINIDTDIKKDLKGKKLEATNPVSKHFPKKPPNENIQVIIQIPDITAREPPLKRARTEEEEPPWKPSPKKQKIMTHGTATLFAGKSIPIGWDSFGEIVNGGCTFLDKTSLIAEFIECNSKVSLVVRPRRFGKTINLTMLRDFFSIPIHPDNKDYRRELFKDTKIMKERSDLIDDYFCKYPVIFLTLKGFDGCKTWSEMQIKLFGLLAGLYEEHKYVSESLSEYKNIRFNQIRSEDENCKRMYDALVDLSKYLKDYHRNKCIVLIDEYDHPLDIAYRYQYYEEARGFFASLFGTLLKSNDENLEKALLVGVSRVAKSGYLSGLNNLDVFPMYDQEYSDKFGFTKDDVSIILQYYNKKGQLKEVKEWYDGYMASKGRIYLYNPWSINKFIRTDTLKAHWIDTGGTTTIKKLLWRSSENFKEKSVSLLKNEAIDIEIMDDLDYDLLSQNVDDVLWTLLYYAGYLTMNKNNHLYIPNMEVFTEWRGWLQNKKSFRLDSMLELLLQGNLAKFKEELPKMIIEILSYHDVTDKLAEAGYHLFMIGLFAQAQFRGYKLTSNKESGLGRFDIKIEPTEKAIYKTGAILEIKIVKKNEKKKNGNDELRSKAEEGLRQISEKCYRSSIPEFTEKLIECGIAFQGKQAYVVGKVFHKMNGQWKL